MAAPDWGAIETAYCAEVLSLREIAELYGDGITEGAIRKRAAKLGWVRNKKSGTQKSTQVRKSGTQKNNVRTTQSPAKSGDGEKYAEGKGDSPQETKPIRGLRTNPPIKPFQHGNQHALRHGGYARRLLLFALPPLECMQMLTFKRYKTLRAECLQMLVFRCLSNLRKAAHQIETNIDVGAFLKSVHHDAVMTYEEAIARLITMPLGHAERAY
ncbi:hypothetical protein [Pectobacterium brasiliense]|uniref:hypothetical protein n=1 Tax=Pectobacterium brasiliense TaxID=180957 RepID=UPI0006897E83|nr:hypothetical protein [Pectobacterium brasiliense]